MRDSRPFRRLLLPVQLLRLLRGQPISHRWGYDRGRPVDRFYIESFLEAHRADIRGRVLEVKDDEYARAYGRSIDHLDVLDIDPSNPRATVVADLSEGDGLPGESYDCFILTQTLQYVYDLGAALRQARRALRPGGVLLATVPSLSRTASDAPELTDYWRFTPASCRALVGREFGDPSPEVTSRGNVLTCVAFLAGLAVEELPRSGVERDDERFPLIVTVRAVKL